MFLDICCVPIIFQVDMLNVYRFQESHTTVLLSLEENPHFFGILSYTLQHFSI